MPFILVMSISEKSVSWRSGQSMSTIYHKVKNMLTEDAIGLF